MKFEDELDAEIEMVPFKELMLIKLKGSREPESKAFSKEYDIAVLLAVAPHTCVAVTRKLNDLDTPLT